MDQITLGSGCFWCLEPIFQELSGVMSVKSGYSGGKIENPTYDDICTGTTGHAEVIQVEFNPTIITLKDLLYVFFHMHDPTTLNSQGNDVGTQYRSAIFYNSNEQKKIAQDYIVEITNQGLYQDVIVTEVSELKEFYIAEDYHQDFYNRNKTYPYCRIIIDPKIQKFKEEIKSKFGKI